MQVFYISLIIFLLALSPEARTEDLPPRLIGVWAAPSCSFSDMLSVQGMSHTLHINRDKEYALLRKAQLNRANFDYFVVQNGPNLSAVQVPEDDVMYVGVLEKDSRIDDRLQWPQLPIKDTIQYKKCNDIPPEPHDASATALETLDVLEHYCRYGTREGCLKEMIKFYDHDLSYTISREEAVKATIIAMYLKPFLGYTPVEDESLKIHLDNAYEQSLFFVDGVFKLLDADLSGEITYDEMDHSTSISLPQLQQQRPYQAIEILMSRYPKLYQ